MTEKHKNIISSNYEELVKLNADHVMVPLVSARIITFEDQDDVNSKTTRREKAKKLLALLLDKPDSAYSVLIDALRKSGSPQLARILEIAGGLVIVVS